MEGATSGPTPSHHRTPPRQGSTGARQHTQRHGRGSTPHTRKRATEEAVHHRHLTHRHRNMETRTSTSTQASHRQQHHTLRFLRRRTRLRIHAKTKQRRSRSHNPLQQGRNRHTREHDRDLPMVQPAKRQRTQPNRSTTQNNRAGNQHRMVTACITGGLQCMPMHRAVPGAAEHPRPAESIVAGQSAPRGWPVPPDPTSHLAALRSLPAI